MSTDLHRRRSVGFKEEGNLHDAESKSSDSHLREEAIFEEKEIKGKSGNSGGKSGGGGKEGGKEGEKGKKIFVKEEEIEEDEEEKELRKAEQRKLIRKEDLSLFFHYSFINLSLFSH